MSILKFIILLANFYSFTLEKKYSTYLDISFLQNINLINSSLSTGGKIISSFGGIYDYDNFNSFLFNYNISYEGPSISYIDRDINERNITQNFTIEWQKKINENKRLRAHISTGWEKIKFQASGSFDDNIYNNNLKGFGIIYDLRKKEDLIYSFSTMYRKINFPNYSDLLYEFKNPFSYNNIKTGLYDNNFYKFGFKTRYKKYFTSIDTVFQNYISQRVIKEDGEYGNEKQKDFYLTFDIGMDKEFNKLQIHPYLSYKYKNSNQNFLRFKSFTDINPSFIEDAYDYNEYSINIPAYTFLLNMDIDFSISYNIKIYSSRPPRNENNDYITSQTQKDKKFIFSLAISREINELASIIFYYSFVYSSSNNKFDVYFPLNYTASSFGFGYKIKY